MSDKYFKVFFGEHEITDYLDVLRGFSFDLSTSRTNKTQAVPGRDGVRYLGSNYDAKIIEMPYQMTRDQQQKKRELAGILNVKNPQKLIFTNEPDKYYLAVPDGSFEVDDEEQISKGTINWLVVDGLSHAVDEKTFVNPTPANRIFKTDFANPPKVSNSMVANKNDVRYGLASFTSLQSPFVVWGAGEQVHVDGLKVAEDGKVTAISRGGNGGTFTYTVAASTIKKGDKLRITTYNAQGGICQADVPVNIVGDPADNTRPPAVGASIAPNPYTIGQTTITGIYSGSVPITKSVLSINGTEKIVNFYRSAALLGSASVGPDGTFLKATEGMNLALNDKIDIAEVSKDSAGMVTQVGAIRRVTVGNPNLFTNTNPTNSLANSGGSVITYKQGVVRTEWDTNLATNVSTTGGTNRTKAYKIAVPTSIVGQKYTFSCFVRNNQTTVLTLVFNGLATNVTVAPNTAQFVTAVLTGNGTNDVQVSFQPIDAATNLNMDVWGMKMEIGDTYTPQDQQSIIPAPNVPLTAPYANPISLGRTTITGAVSGPLNAILPQVFTPNPFLLAQWLVKFDAIWAIDYKYPGTFDGLSTIAEKVALAKKIIRRINPSINAKGTSPMGDSCYVQVWVGGAWVGSENNKTNLYKKMGYNQTNPTIAARYIQDDGYVYLNAYSDLSNVSIASGVIMDYAEMELEISTPNQNYIEIENKGTYPVYPRFSIDMPTQNGTAVLVNENGDVIQIGNPDEVDGVPYKSTEMVIDERWEGTSVPPNWSVNTGQIRYKNNIANNLPNKISGSINYTGNRDEISPIYAPETDLVWHGPTVHRDIPAPIGGKRNGNFTYKNRSPFKTERNTINRLEVNLQSGNDVVLSLVLRDSSPQIKDVVVELWIFNDLWHSFILDYKRFTAAFYGLEINKINGKIEFKVIDIKAINNEIVTGRAVEMFSYYVPSMDNVDITSLTTWFNKYGQYPHSYEAISDTKFTWIDAKNWNDIKNVFEIGDVLDVDTSAAKISVNGEVSTTLGALGNQWDKFKVPPGKHKYYLYPSTWADQPKISATIREAYL